MDYFLQMKNISKTFGEVAALHDVNFEVGDNEIVGLLGDNGAGKSTLVKIITGYHQPDPGGEFYLKGKKRGSPLRGPGPRDSGIEVVYQERALADKQSLWRNIFMGRELSTALGQARPAAACGRRRASSCRPLMGFTSSAITPESTVKTFSGGERQGVAITRALYFKAEMIILDEPTMGLSLSETKKCLDFVAGHQGGREGRHLHRPQHLPRLSGGGQDRRAGPRHDGRAVHEERAHPPGAHRPPVRGGADGAASNDKGEALMTNAGEAGRPLSRTAGRGWLAAVLAHLRPADRHRLVAIFIWLLFLIGSPRTFLAGEIYISFMSATPFFALIAIPLTLVVIRGEIDLSFPSIMAFGMTAFDLVFTATDSVWLGFVACLLAGLGAGLLNGVIVVRIGIPSLVATIGTQFFWAGAVLVLTNGQGLGMTAVRDTILHPLFVGRIFGVIPAQFVWTIIIGAGHLVLPEPAPLRRARVPDG